MATINHTSPVLDTSGKALKSGIDYYIKPASTYKGGALTLINREPYLCPLYVGQGNVSGWPFQFKPFFDGETVVRESRDQMIISRVSTHCRWLNSWSIEKANPEDQGKLIAMQEPARGKLPNGKYFRITRSQPEVDGKSYILRWCPTDMCPNCTFADCGNIGSLDSNGGKRFLALNGSALPVVFERA
ncbi:kunitz type trypsin inhibitor 104-like [Rosa chinensis]|uniref:kunitz type trypsin inhibitor 104-like n=1 Tax=Rosa chinensis TaxID=74649 RepID=UPI000D08D86B|nr:kunitz type trypsin inhibitor 104-like [Rosa chinensis]